MNTSNTCRKPTKTIYEITVELDDDRCFVYRVDSEDQVREHFSKISDKGFMNTQPGMLELFLPHRIKRVVAFGADLNIEKG